MSLLSFFQSRRDVLNISGVEAKIGLPTRTLYAWLSEEGPLPAAHWEKVEAWARENGYVPEPPEPAAPAPRKLTMLEKEARDRAKMVAEYQKGATAADLATRFGYEKSTVNKYLRDYAAQGVAALNKQRRLRQPNVVTPAVLRTALDAEANETKRGYLSALLAVAEKKITLKEAAASAGVSEQYLLKVRRLLGNSVG